MVGEGVLGMILFKDQPRAFMYGIASTYFISLDKSLPTFHITKQCGSEVRASMVNRIYLFYMQASLVINQEEDDY